MRTLAALALAILLVGAPAYAQSYAQSYAQFESQTESEAVAQAHRLGETFARGFYVGSPDLVLETVHPALSKLGVWPNIRNSGRDGLLSLPPGTLNIFAVSHNADGHLDPATAVTQVEMLDEAEDVSVFRLIAAQDWFDYHLAARIGDRWLIVNCVFGGLPDLEAPVSDADRAAALAAAQAYAAAVRSDDYAALAAATHLDFTRRSVRTQPPERLIVETHETLAQDMTGRALGAAPSVNLLAITRVTAAARIDTPNQHEWVFMLRIDGAWQPVNAFRAPA